MTPATVAEMLSATLSSQRWTVRRHEAREDLLVTDPQGTRTYLIGLRAGQDPVHFGAIAQLERTAGLLSGQEGRQVTPVLFTSQPVPKGITELGVQVVRATGSDQETAETALRFLWQEEG